MKSSTYYFLTKTKILTNFQICISVPLKQTSKNEWQLIAYANFAKHTDGVGFI